MKPSKDSDGDEEWAFYGKLLRIHRKDAGLTQTELANRLGVTPGYLSHLESGVRRIDAKMLFGMLSVLWFDPEAEGKTKKDFVEDLAALKEFAINMRNTRC